MADFLNSVLNGINTGANLANAQNSAAIYAEMQQARMIEETQQRALFWVQDKEQQFGRISEHTQLYFASIFLVQLNSGRWQAHWFANHFAIYNSLKGKAENALWEYPRRNKAEDFAAVQIAAIIDNRNMVNRCAREAIGEIRGRIDSAFGLRKAEVEKRKKAIEQTEAEMPKEGTSSTGCLLAVGCLLVFALFWWWKGFLISASVTTGVGVIGYFALASRIAKENAAEKAKFQAKVAALPVEKAKRYELLKVEKESLEAYAKQLSAIEAKLSLPNISEPSDPQQKSAEDQTWSDICAAVNRDFNGDRTRPWSSGEIALIANKGCILASIVFNGITFPIKLEQFESELPSLPAPLL